MRLLVPSTRRPAPAGLIPPGPALAGLPPVPGPPALLDLAEDVPRAARRPLRGRAEDLPPQPSHPSRRDGRPLPGLALPGNGHRPRGPGRPAPPDLRDPDPGRPPGRGELAPVDRRSPLDLRDAVGRDPLDSPLDGLVDLADLALP